MDPGTVGVLLLVAGAAGWVDAVVGGGGLLLLPALLVAAPEVPVATLLGTNKLTAVTGTTMAAATYARRTALDRPVVGPAAALALVCSGLGAVVATRVPSTALKPVVLVVLVAVALVVTLRPRVGLTARPERRTPARRAGAIVLAGGLLGCYDGMIGPGTGTFLVLAFAAVVGADFLHGAAMAKLVNAATNLGALVVFALGGHVWWLLGATLALGNVLGAVLGARTALHRGSGFVRRVLLVVVLVLAARVGLDLARG